MVKMHPALRGGGGGAHEWAFNRVQSLGAADNAERERERERASENRTRERECERESERASERARVQERERERERERGLPAPPPPPEVNHLPFLAKANFPCSLNPLSLVCRMNEHSRKPRYSSPRMAGGTSV